VRTAADTTAYAATPAGSPSSGAVVVAGLHKSYGAVQAVRGMTFTVAYGEIFALLGPNGAVSAGTLGPNDRNPLTEVRNVFTPAPVPAG
jgi:hypothetical protein